LVKEADIVVDKLGDELNAVNTVTKAYADQRDTLYDLINAMMQYAAL
jgi:hypothetical protein